MAYPQPWVQPTPKKSVLPDYDLPFSLSNPGSPRAIIVDSTDNEEAIARAVGTSVRAAGIITTTNAGGTGDKVSVTIRNITVSATNGGADSVTTLTAALVLAINTHGVLSRIVSATGNAGVLTVRAIYPGQIANGFAFSVAVTGTAASTVTVAWAGGTGDIVTPLQDFTIQVGKNTISMRAGRPFISTVAVRAALTGTTFMVS